MMLNPVTDELALRAAWKLTNWRGFEATNPMNCWQFADHEDAADPEQNC
jgi:hypothetical protein